MWLDRELQKKEWVGGDRNWTNREAAALLSFLCLVWIFGFYGRYRRPAILWKESAIADGGQWSFGRPRVWLRCFCLSLLSVSGSHPVCSSLRLTSWFQKCVESGFRYHGDEGRGSEGGCTFEMRRVALSCVFCVKVDRKCQNRCASAAELLANSAPFAVTRHPVWHYSGSPWVVRSPHSFGGAW